ncbi:dynamin family protein [Campylobacter hominis]|uniref:Dynamin family protein n=1 Tax=Campylobacter hominis (strain ATCC BAA-381 / DSM 21671 / CCUG 45161 / LMG 19568 / NCTC 13146 / CH001A) TaxID=360107 RepID=A7I1H0_CAMHC|nr:dynamin family protein [Campylobacter hominis]ABS51072.1 dynamin family protein [Campylobacter hominis ATCC BAA-381]UAK86333.1 dynamin family protein [Campylobacter hominis]SUW84902.1 dynamin family protein [Campylobacter hominis]
MLEIFEKSKDELVEIYGELVENKAINLNNVNEETLKEKSSNLQKEEFILAVAGQIKAGKSTLLNALIFGNDILPSDDTPYTAKITEIRYGSDKKLKAIFYTKDEWQELKNEITEIDDKKVNYFKNFIEPDIKNSSYIKFLNQTKEDDISNLKEYVAKGGVYTPFVKSVEIYYPAEILKSLVVVDTPGTNDPNIFRSKITLDWIKRCDAAIYATYAGRAFDESDIKFINEYLLSLENSKRIVAINKIDVLRNFDEAKELLENNKKNETYQKTVFNKASSFVFTAGLYALLDEKEKNGFLLNEDELWYKDEANPEFWKNNGLNELKNLVSDKIIQNKGKDLLISNINFIKDAFEKKEVFLNTEINALETKISQNQKSKDETSKALAEVTNFRKKLTKMQDNFKNNIDDNLAQKIKNLNKDIDREFNDIKNTIASKTNNYRRITELKNNIKWDIKNALESEKLKMDDLVSQAMEDIKQYTKNETEEFINEMSKFEAFDSESLRQTLRYDTFDIYRDFSKFFDADFINRDILEDIAFENFNLLKRVVFQGARTYIPKVRDFAIEMVDESKKELQEKILNNINSFGEKLCAQVPNSIKTVLFNNQKDLENIKEKGTLNEKELNELITNLNEKENNINNFKEIKENFMKKLENMEGEIYGK